MKRIITVLAAVLMAALCAAAAWGIDYGCWLREKEPVRETVCENLYEDEWEALVYNNIENQDGDLKITGEDPWVMVYPDSFMEMDHVRVRLNKPVESDFRLQVYYAGTDMSLSEPNSVFLDVAAGTEQIDVSLPRITYGLLRFDFDGEVSLAGFESVRTEEHEPERTTDWFRTAAVFVLLGAVCGTGFVLKRKKQLKRGLICLAAGLLAATAVEAAIWYASPNSQIYIQDTEDPGYLRLYPDMTGAVYNCTLDFNGHVEPTDADPQIHFPTYSAEIQGILITLAEPAAENIPVQVFYGADGFKYAPRHSVKAGIIRGTTQLAVTIPELNYHLIRVDFDKPVHLQSITASREPVAVSHAPFGMDWLRWILVAIGTAGLLLAVRSRAWAGRMSERTIRILDWAYAVFAGALMLHHLYVMAYYPTIMTGVPWLNIPFIAFAAISTIRGKMWQDKGFWFFTAYFLAVLLRVMIPNPEQLSAAEIPLMTGIYAIFGCYAAGRALRPEMRKGFLLAMCSILTAAIAFVSAVGIYVAWADASLTTPGGSGIYLLLSRLFLIFHSSTSGNLVSVCAVVALFGAFLAKHKWAKALFVLASVEMVLTNALTATRTGYLTLAAAFAMTVCMALYQPLGRNSVGKRSVLLGVRNGIILTAVFAGLFLSLTYGQTYIVDGFNKVKFRGGIMLRNALADGSSGNRVRLAHRGFSEFTNLSGLFSGRFTIWRSAIQNLKDNPQAGIWGWSVVNPMEHGTNQVLIQSGETFEHTHNLYIQTALENGIVGLALFLGGVLSAVIGAVKLIRSQRTANRRSGTPWWQKALFIPMFAILVQEMDECMVIFARGYIPMMVLYLFMGMIAACSAKEPAGRGGARPETVTEGTRNDMGGTSEMTDKDTEWIRSDPNEASGAAEKEWVRSDPDEARNLTENDPERVRNDPVEEPGTTDKDAGIPGTARTRRRTGNPEP